MRRALAILQYNAYRYATGRYEMAITLRLTRTGTKKRPFYRVVAVDSAARRDGRPLDFVGHYNPMTNPAQIHLDAEKIKKWLDLGATPSETVKSLLKKQAG